MFSLSVLAIITLDTGTYSANTPMSANDLAFFQPLINMNIEQATNYLKHKIFIRLDSSRNETQSSVYFCVRASGQAFDRAWYDIQINFNGFGSFTLMPTRLENGTY